MTLTKPQKAIRFALVIVLILLIFMPAQIPLPALKTGFVIGLALSALVLQFIILKQTPAGTYRTQGVILMILTIAISGILLFI